MKKFLSLFLMCILILGIAPDAKAFTHSNDIESFGYSDVRPEDWYYNAVMTLSVKRIVGGRVDGRFYPKDTVHRAEALKLILDTAGTEIEKAPSGPDDWYKDYLYTAQKLGIVNAEFCEQPTKPITCEELAGLVTAVFGQENPAIADLLSEYGISGADSGNTVKRCDICAVVLGLRRILQVQHARELAPFYGLPSDIAWTEQPNTRDALIDDILIEFVNGDYNTAFFYNSREATKSAVEALNGDFSARNIFHIHPDIGGFIVNLHMEARGWQNMLIIQMDEPALDLQTIFAQQTEALQFARNLSEEFHKNGTLTDGMSQKEIAEVYYKWFQNSGVKAPETGEQGGINVLYDTAYATLIRKEAACVGRAAGYALCLNVEGIPCRGMSGHFKGTDSGHVLNFMLLDGEAYLSDWGNNRAIALVDKFDSSFVPDPAVLEYALATVTPPTPSHTHAWAEAWTTNATHHWHECTASGCDITANSDKDSYGAHTYDDDADTTCNDCGYIRAVTPPTPSHTHAWAEVWTANATHHWHECTADGCDITENSDKDAYSEHTYDDAADATCNDCGYTRTVTPPVPEHTHSWSTAWTANATYHWHECTAVGCPITANNGKDGYSAHIYDDAADTVCNICGYTRTVIDPTDTDCYITIPSFPNGTIIPTTRNAAPGERVTLYAHPDDGYELDTLTVKDIRGRNITLRSMGDNAYSFRMPAARVTVDAVFTKIAADTPATTPAEDEPFTGLGTPGISGIVLNPGVMPFTDVKSTDWFYNNVDYVWKHYLMSGVSDTQFAPNLTTSRAMIWTILARMNNVRTDINPGSTWYEKGLLWAREQGVTDGTNPMSDITREQLATMLWRNAGRPAPGAAADLSRFSDSDTVSSYAQTAVRWAVSVGILNGSDGKIDPQGTATRAQVAAMVNRYGEKIGK